MLLFVPCFFLVCCFWGVVVSCVFGVHVVVFVCAICGAALARAIFAIVIRALSLRACSFLWRILGLCSIWPVFFRLLWTLDGGAFSRAVTASILFCATLPVLSTDALRVRLSRSACVVRGLSLGISAIAIPKAVHLLLVSLAGTATISFLTWLGLAVLLLTRARISLVVRFVVTGMVGVVVFGAGVLVLLDAGFRRGLLTLMALAVAILLAGAAGILLRLGLGVRLAAVAASILRRLVLWTVVGAVVHLAVSVVVGVAVVRRTSWATDSSPVGATDLFCTPAAPLQSGLSSPSRWLSGTYLTCSGAAEISVSSCLRAACCRRLSESYSGGHCFSIAQVLSCAYFCVCCCYSRFILSCALHPLFALPWLRCIVGVFRFSDLIAGGVAAFTRPGCWCLQSAFVHWQRLLIVAVYFVKTRVHDETVGAVRQYSARAPGETVCRSHLIIRWSPCVSGVCRFADRVHDETVGIVREVGPGGSVAFVLLLASLFRSSFLASGAVWPRVTHVPACFVFETRVHDETVGPVRQNVVGAVVGPSSGATCGVPFLGYVCVSAFAVCLGSGSLLLSSVLFGPIISGSHFPFFYGCFSYLLFLFCEIVFCQRGKNRVSLGMALAGGGHGTADSLRDMPVSGHSEVRGAASDLVGSLVSTGLPFAGNATASVVSGVPAPGTGVPSSSVSCGGKSGSPVGPLGPVVIASPCSVGVPMSGPEDGPVCESPFFSRSRDPSGVLIPRRSCPSTPLRKSRAPVVALSPRSAACLMAQEALDKTPLKCADGIQRSELRTPEVVVAEKEGFQRGGRGAKLLVFGAVVKTPGGSEKQYYSSSQIGRGFSKKLMLPKNFRRACTKARKEFAADVRGIVDGTPERLRQSTKLHGGSWLSCNGRGRKMFKGTADGLVKGQFQFCDSKKKNKLNKARKRIQNADLSKVRKQKRKSKDKIVTTPRRSRTSADHARDNSKRSLERTRLNDLKKNSNRTPESRRVGNSKRTPESNRVQSSKRTPESRRGLNSKRTPESNRVQSLKRTPESRKLKRKLEPPRPGRLRPKRQMYLTKMSRPKNADLPGGRALAKLKAAATKKTYRTNFIHYSLQEKVNATLNRRDQSIIWRKFHWNRAEQAGKTNIGSAFASLYNSAERLDELNFTSPLHKLNLGPLGSVGDTEHPSNKTLCQLVARTVMRCVKDEQKFTSDFAAAPRTGCRWCHEAKPGRKYNADAVCKSCTDKQSKNKRVIGEKEYDAAEVKDTFSGSNGTDMLAFETPEAEAAYVLLVDTYGMPSEIESMMMARFVPRLQITYLRCGQTGYKGHVVTFYNDAARSVTCLPRPPGTLPLVLLKLYGKTYEVPKDGEKWTGEVKDVFLNEDVLDYERLRAWLKFLVRYNKYYQDRPDNPYGGVEVDWAALKVHIKEHPLASIKPGRVEFEPGCAGVDYVDAEVFAEWLRSKSAFGGSGSGRSMLARTFVKAIRPHVALDRKKRLERAAKKAAKKASKARSEKDGKKASKASSKGSKCSKGRAPVRPAAVAGGVTDSVPLTHKSILRAVWRLQRAYKVNKLNAYKAHIRKTFGEVTPKTFALFMKSFEKDNLYGTTLDGGRVTPSTHVLFGTVVYLILQHDSDHDKAWVERELGKDFLRSSSRVKWWRHNIFTNMDEGSNVTGCGVDIPGVRIDPRHEKIAVVNRGMSENQKLTSGFAHLLESAGRKKNIKAMDWNPAEGFSPGELVLYHNRSDEVLLEGVVVAHIRKGISLKVISERRYSVRLVETDRLISVCGEALARRPLNADELAAVMEKRTVVVNDKLPAYSADAIAARGSEPGFFALQFPQLWCTGVGDIFGRRAGLVKRVPLQRFVTNIWWHFSGLVMTNRRARVATFDAIMRANRFKDANIFLDRLSDKEKGIRPSDITSSLKQGGMGRSFLNKFHAFSHKEKGAVNYFKKRRRPLTCSRQQVPGLGVFLTWSIDDLNSPDFQRFVEVSPQYNFRMCPAEREKLVRMRKNAGISGRSAKLRVERYLRKAANGCSSIREFGTVRSWLDRRDAMSAACAGFDKRARAQRRDNVECYPALAVAFFQKRMEIIGEHVLKDLYGSMSSLLRYEFQKRGSVHGHRQDRLMGQPVLYDYTESFGRSRLGIPAFGKLNSILCFGKAVGIELDVWPLSVSDCSVLRLALPVRLATYVSSLKGGLSRVKQGELLERALDGLRGLQLWATDTVRFGEAMIHAVNRQYDSSMKGYVEKRTYQANPSNEEVMAVVAGLALADLGPGRRAAMVDLSDTCRRHCMFHKCAPKCKGTYKAKKKRRSQKPVAAAGDAAPPAKEGDVPPKSSNQTYCRYGFNGVGKCLRPRGKIVRQTWHPEQGDCYRFECARNNPRENASDLASFLFSRSNMDMTLLVMDEAGPDYILKYQVKGESASDMCKHAADAAKKIGKSMTLKQLMCSVSIRSARERAMGSQEMIMRIDPSLPMVVDKGLICVNINYHSSYVQITERTFLDRDVDTPIVSKKSSPFESYENRPEYFFRDKLLERGKHNEARKDDPSIARREESWPLNVLSYDIHDPAVKDLPSFKNGFVGDGAWRDRNAESPSNNLRLWDLSCDSFYKIFKFSVESSPGEKGSAPPRSWVTERDSVHCSKNLFRPLAVINWKPGIIVARRPRTWTAEEVVLLRDSTTKKSRAACKRRLKYERFMEHLVHLYVPIVSHVIYSKMEFSIFPGQPISIEAVLLLDPLMPFTRAWDLFQVSSVCPDPEFMVSTHKFVWRDPEAMDAMESESESEDEVSPAKAVSAAAAADDLGSAGTPECLEFWETHARTYVSGENHVVAGKWISTMLLDGDGGSGGIRMDRVRKLKDVSLQQLNGHQQLAAAVPLAHMLLQKINLSRAEGAGPLRPEDVGCSDQAHLAACLSPMQMQMLGRAGSGKSYCLGAIKKHGDDIAIGFPRCVGYVEPMPGVAVHDAVYMTATTNKAAFALGPGADTIHRAYALPVTEHCKGWTDDLKPKAAKDLQGAWSDVRVVCIDECSQMGLETYGLMEARVRQAKAGTACALCTVSCGDYGQLGGVNLCSPIAASDLAKLLAEKPRHLNDRKVIAQKGVGSFEPNACIILRENWRQSKFPAMAGVLNKIYAGEHTIPNFNWLMGNCSKAAHEDRCKTYAKYLDGRRVVRLYLKNKDCDKYNKKRAVDLALAVEHAVARVVSVDMVVGSRPTRKGRKYKKYTAEMAGQVEKQNGPQLARVLDLAPGVRVMLDQTLYKKAGLVKNAVGTVILVAAKKNDVTGVVAFDYVATHFPHYCGPVWPGAAGLKNLVPDCLKVVDGKEDKLYWERIVPVGMCDVTWEHYEGGGLHTCMRYQIPLTAAEAMTFHKAQGGTFRYVVLEVSMGLKPKHVMTGVDYVALSRTVSPENLCLIPAIDSKGIWVPMNHKRFFLSRDDKDVKVWLAERREFMAKMRRLQVQTVKRWVPVCEKLGLLKKGMPHTGTYGYELAVQHILGVTVLPPPCAPASGAPGCSSSPRVPAPVPACGIAPVRHSVVAYVDLNESVTPLPDDDVVIGSDGGCPSVAGSSDSDSAVPSPVTRTSASVSLPVPGRVVRPVPELCVRVGFSASGLCNLQVKSKFWLSDSAWEHLKDRRKRNEVPAGFGPKIQKPTVSTLSFTLTYGASVGDLRERVSSRLGVLLEDPSPFGIDVIMLYARGVLLADDKALLDDCMLSQGPLMNFVTVRPVVRILRDESVDDSFARLNLCKRSLCWQAGGASVNMQFLRAPPGAAVVPSCVDSLVPCKVESAFNCGVQIWGLSQGALLSLCGTKEYLHDEVVSASLQAALFGSTTDMFVPQAVLEIVSTVNRISGTVSTALDQWAADFGLASSVGRLSLAWSSLHDIVVSLRKDLPPDCVSSSLFAYERVHFPFCIANAHWVLIVFYPSMNVFKFYDSLVRLDYSAFSGAHGSRAAVLQLCFDRVKLLLLHGFDALFPPFVLSAGCLMSASNGGGLVSAYRSALSGAGLVDMRFSTPQQESGCFSCGANVVAAVVRLSDPSLSDVLPPDIFGCSRIVRRLVFGHLYSCVVPEAGLSPSVVEQLVTDARLVRALEAQHPRTGVLGSAPASAGSKASPGQSSSAPGPCFDTDFTLPGHAPAVCEPAWLMRRYRCKPLYLKRAAYVRAKDLGRFASGDVVQVMVASVLEEYYKSSMTYVLAPDVARVVRAVAATPPGPAVVGGLVSPPLSESDESLPSAVLGDDAPERVLMLSLNNEIEDARVLSELSENIRCGFGPSVGGFDAYVLQLLRSVPSISPHIDWVRDLLQYAPESVDEGSHVTIDSRVRHDRSGLCRIAAIASGSYDGQLMLSQSDEVESAIHLQDLHGHERDWCRSSLGILLSVRLSSESFDWALGLVSVSPTGVGCDVCVGSMKARCEDRCDDCMGTLSHELSDDGIERVLAMARGVVSIPSVFMGYAVYEAMFRAVVAIPSPIRSPLASVSSVDDSCRGGGGLSVSAESDDGAHCLRIGLSKRQFRGRRRVGSDDDDVDGSGSAGGAAAANVAVTPTALAGDPLFDDSTVDVDCTTPVPSCPFVFVDPLSFGAFVIGTQVGPGVRQGSLGTKMCSQIRATGVFNASTEVVCLTFNTVGHHFSLIVISRDGTGFRVMHLDPLRGTHRGLLAARKAVAFLRLVWDRSAVVGSVASMPGYLRDDFVVGDAYPIVPQQRDSISCGCFCAVYVEMIVEALKNGTWVVVLADLLSSSGLPVWFDVGLPLIRRSESAERIRAGLRSAYVAAGPRCDVDLLDSDEPSFAAPMSTPAVGRASTPSLSARNVPRSRPLGCPVPRMGGDGGGRKGGIKSFFSPVADSEVYREKARQALRNYGAAAGADAVDARMRSTSFDDEFIASEDGDSGSACSVGGGSGGGLESLLCSDGDGGGRDRDVYRAVHSEVSSSGDASGLDSGTGSGSDSSITPRNLFLAGEAMEVDDD